MSNELLPCPFCGSDVEANDTNYTVWHHNENCPLNNLCITVVNWNTRADKAAPVERIDGLKQAVIKFEYDFANVTENEFEALQKAARAYLALQGGE